MGQIYVLPADGGDTNYWEWWKPIFNPLKLKRERRESGLVVWDIAFKNWRKSQVYGYEGPQAVPARPSGKGGLERR
jgi:hypothetical protein